MRTLRALSLVALALALMAPSPPMCTVSGTVYNTAGLPAPGTVLTFTSLIAQAVGGVEVAPSSFTTTSGVNGAFSVNIPQGLRVNVAIGRTAPAIALTIPGASGADLGNLLAGAAPGIPASSNLVSGIAIGTGGDFTIGVANPSGRGQATLTPGTVKNFTLTSDSSAGSHRVTNLAVPGASGDALSEGQAIGAITPIPSYVGNQIIGAGSNPSIKAFDVNNAINVQAHGAAGNITTTTTGTTSGVVTITPASTTSFATNQGIVVYHAGPACAVGGGCAAGAAPTLAFTGVCYGATPGSSTVSYEYSFVDALGGYTPVSAAGTITNAPATLTATNCVNITFPSLPAGAVAVAFYRQLAGAGPYNFWAFSTGNTATTLFDAGQNDRATPAGVGTTLTNLNFPATAPAVSAAGNLVTTIDAIGGGVVTLHAAPSQTIGSANVAHDDSAAFSASLALCGATRNTVYLPPGTYNLAAQTTIPSSCTMVGTGASSILRRADYYPLTLLQLASAAAGVVLRDFAYDGNAQAFDANTGLFVQFNNAVDVDIAHTFVHNNTDKPFSGQGHYIRYVNNRIQDSYFRGGIIITNPNASGVEPSGHDIIASNEFNNISDNSIDPADCDYCVIANNVVVADGQQKNSQGMQPQYGNHLTIANNTIFAPNNNGILYGAGTDSLRTSGTDVKVIGNTVQSGNIASKDAIQLVGTMTVAEISDNVVVGSIVTSPNGSDFIVVGNSLVTAGANNTGQLVLEADRFQAVGNHADSISIRSQSQNLTSGLVSHNWTTNVQNTTTGITVKAVCSNTLAGIRVLDNVIGVNVTPTQAFFVDDVGCTTAISGLNLIDNDCGATPAACVYTWNAVDGGGDQIRNLRPKIQSKTGGYAVVRGDDVISECTGAGCGGPGTNVTVTLICSTAFQSGQRIRVIKKDADAHTVIVAANTAGGCTDTVNFAANFTIAATQGKGVYLELDGTNWDVIGQQ